jgi:hypothetical protein
LLVAISLGFVIGSWASGVTGLLLVLTRRYRLVRNPFVLSLCYIVWPALTLGSLLLLGTTLELIGVGVPSSQHDAALFACAISFLCGVLIAVRGEIRWRKSIGLHEKKLPYSWKE